MGLDMYLSRRIHIANYAHDPDGQALTKKILHALDVKPSEIIERGFLQIDLPVAYWRKANAIHAWFVHNVQGDKDDCGYYECSDKQLQDLVDLCKEVLKGEKAGGRYLPTQEGFFFGSYDYGEWYIEGLTDTVKMLENALKSKGPAHNWFVYHSSW